MSYIVQKLVKLFHAWEKFVTDKQTDGQKDSLVKPKASKTEEIEKLILGKIVGQ